MLRLPQFPVWLRCNRRAALPCAAASRRGLGARVAPVLVVALALTACGKPEPAAEVWPPLRVERTVLDIVAAFAEGSADVSVLAQDPEAPLSAEPAVFEKSSLASDADHTVLRARPESAFEVRAGPFGPQARLVVRTFVFSHFRNDPARADPAPALFRVLLDGAERVAVRSDYINEPGTREHPYDIALRSFEVPLDGVAGRAFTLRFETTREGRTLPPGAVPAEPLWWDLRVEEPLLVPRAAASPAQPNLIVAMVDTLGARRMSVHGYERDTTPVLSRFAAGGTFFERALSPSSWTLPATASLLTGLAPNTHGVLGDARSYLMDGLVTWPERLREAGLFGAAFVANALVAQANNFHQGFEHWEQANEDRADALIGRFGAWLDGQPEGARWFAYLHFMDPHAPYSAPGEWRERYTEGYEERRDFGGFLPNRLQRGEIEPLTPEEQAHVTALYDGEVAGFDAAFGRLLADLERRGLTETTVIALVSDHGEELFEHGSLGHGYSLHDELLHVPLILAGPGVPVGKRVAEVVDTRQLAAQLLAFARLDAPGLPPPLLAPDASREVVFGAVRTQLFGPARQLVSAEAHDGRKVIVTLDAQGQAAAVERYDRRTDPDEQHPLAESELNEADRHAFAALVSLALEWSRETAAARPVGEQREVSDMEQRLKEVGYLGDAEPAGSGAPPR